MRSISVGLHAVFLHHRLEPLGGGHGGGFDCTEIDREAERMRQMPTLLEIA